MRVYFLSCAPAVLKLNGLYAGSVDGFERHVELDPADRIFAEIVPGDNMQAVNFFLDEKFFSSPPPFVDLYLADGDAFVYVREYSAKDVKIEVVFQTRFNGNLITVFSQGGIYLSAEGAEYSLTPLPQAFKQLRAEKRTLCGRDVLVLYGGNMLAVISDLGKIIFLNAVESAEFGDELKTVTPFETCTAAKAQCTYSYDGEELTLIESVTAESRPPEADILHFAFFESILTCGNYADYLDASLKAILIFVIDLIPCVQRADCGRVAGYDLSRDPLAAKHRRIEGSNIVADPHLIRIGLADTRDITAH